MKVSATLADDIRYIADLARAGLDGIVSARETAVIPAVPINLVWAPAAIGAALGASAASLRGNGRSRSKVVLGSLVGCVVGLGCGVGWNSRGFAGALARGAMRNIGGARDARWLTENPIDYA